MKIHYFPDEKDVGTTFSFEDEKGNDNVNEMKEFSLWLDSMDLHFTKVKLRQGGGRATSCIVVEGLESDDEEEEEEEQDNQDEQFKSGLMEALFHLQNKVTTMENSSPKVEQAEEVEEAEEVEDAEEAEEAPVKVEEPVKQAVEEKPAEKKESDGVKKKKKKKEKKEKEVEE